MIKKSKIQGMKGFVASVLLLSLGCVTTYKNYKIDGNYGVSHYPYSYHVTIKNGKRIDSFIDEKKGIMITDYNGDGTIEKISFRATNGVYIPFKKEKYKKLIIEQQYKCVKFLEDHPKTFSFSTYGIAIPYK